MPFKVKTMNVILPAREVVIAHGWTHQVQWEEGGNPCLVRVKSGWAADAWFNLLRKRGFTPILVDLVEEMQLH